ncbi:phosphoadenosine phosphosulfate reductase, partial [Oceanospirillum sp. D5]|nr:phosphoadenosine phosphosulfate reductase [Oceanospirillum sediminis]
QNIEQLIPIFKNTDFGQSQEKVHQVLFRKITPDFTFDQKLNTLLDSNVKAFNHLVFDFLKTTDYPLAKEEAFPLIENDEILVKADIFRILEESGVGVPAYYNKIEFEINGKKGEYARSRSGCFFCFFQQKIEWVWLYEQHP